jgi:hypothetical protein
MIIITPEDYEVEQRVQISTVGRVETWAVSGYANFFKGWFVNANGDEIPDGTDESHWIYGDYENDWHWNKFEAHLTVGPKWTAIRDVSPLVTIAAWDAMSPDEDDASGMFIDNCTWATVGHPDVSPPFEQIELIVPIRIRGGQYSIDKLGYQFVAVGARTLD